MSSFTLGGDGELNPPEKRFLLPTKATEHFGFNQKKIQWGRFEEKDLPLSLPADPRYETHITAGYVPVQIQELSAKFPELFYYGWEESWYRMNSLSKVTPVDGWYLVPKEPTQDLAKEKRLPVAVMVYTALLVYMESRGQIRLFHNALIPCLETDLYGKQVCLQFLENGLYLTWDPRIQLATDRSQTSNQSN